MPRAKKEVPAEGSGNVPSTPENNPNHFQKSKTEFSVINADGGVARTYTVEIHGENAEALAHEYAANHGGTVV